jgi:effector-binding domain-containing protein
MTETGTDNGLVDSGLADHGLTVEPAIIERAEQPYIYIRRQVTMDNLSEVADEIPGLLNWLAERRLEPAGAPFFKYNVVNRSGTLNVEAGVPAADGLIGDDRVLVGVLPAGRFASVTHFGHFDGLREVTGALLDWGTEHDVVWDMSETDHGQQWGMRLELYKTNPADQPDPNQWETELLFRLLS